MSDDCTCFDDAPLVLLTGPGRRPIEFGGSCRFRALYYRRVLGLPPKGLELGALGIDTRPFPPRHTVWPRGMGEPTHLRAYYEAKRDYAMGRMDRRVYVGGTI